MAKKTNVSENSIKAYQEIVSEGLVKRETAQVLNLMATLSKPLTSREIMNITHKERGNITRILYDLIKQKRIEISKKDKCPETQRTVSFYSIIAA